MLHFSGNYIGNSLYALKIQVGLGRLQAQQCGFAGLKMELWILQNSYIVVREGFILHTYYSAPTYNVNHQNQTKNGIESKIPCPNVSTTAMFTSQYYLKLKGKHCQKLHRLNGVVNHLGLFSFSSAQTEKNLRKILQKTRFIVW